MRLFNVRTFAQWMFVFMSILALSACSNKQHQTSISHFEHDGFHVGYKKLIVFSKESREKFPMAVVYPTHTPAKEVSFGSFDMSLSIGAKIAEGTFALVIISHGSGGTNLGYRSIAFELVKRGFVVGIPLHPKNNYQNNEAQGTTANWVNRPLHIRASMDALLSNTEFSKSIDAHKVAVIGHSAGGYTALAVAGGVADTKHIIEFCENNPKSNEPFCGQVKENKIEPKEIKNIADKRIKALVLMAPVGILFKSEQALSAVNIPAFILPAQKDSELTEPYHSKLISKNYKDKKLVTYCTVKNAGHYSFITPFPKVMKKELGLVAQDPQGFDRQSFHQSLSAEIYRYLDAVLNEKDEIFDLPAFCLEHAEIKRHKR